MEASKRFLTAALILLITAPIFADTRKDNIDVIVALDKSLSMEQKIRSVEDWLNSYVIDQMLIPGDTLVVIAFYGKADVVISQQITDSGSKDTIKMRILQIRGNGRFTDIGNALDIVRKEVDSRANDGREKYILLLTDGIQEAPPGSKYYSKNGVFNHEFLANTKTILQKGWKVMILGIGTGTAAKDLARELQGSYGEVTSDLTVNNLTATTGALFGAASVEGSVSVSPVGRGGESTLTMTLKSSGLTGDAEITVSDITANVGGRSIPGVLPEPATIEVKKDATTTVRLPLRFSEVPDGTSPATLDFAFSSPARFTPSSVSVSIAPQGFVQSFVMGNLPFLIAGLVVLLVLIALVIFLVRRSAKGGPVRVGLLVGDEPVGPQPLRLSSREVFLNENAGAFGIVSKRNAKSFASFAARGGRVVLTILKQDRFPKVSDVPSDALGRSFPFKSENGRSLTLEVRSTDKESKPVTREPTPEPAKTARSTPRKSPGTRRKK
ncbi:MAG TPA: vWA domain-containing protein [Spirochaetia bacterium]